VTLIFYFILSSLEFFVYSEQSALRAFPERQANMHDFTFLDDDYDIMGWIDGTARVLTQWRWDPNGWSGEDFYGYELVD
jgi:hypothetical protein